MTRNNEMPTSLRRKRCLFLQTSLIAMAICLSASAGQVDSTPQQVFDSMRGSFQPAKAKGVHARYQWELSGPQGGQWWIDVNDGTYKMGKGKIDNPSVTFITSDADWVAMSNGKLKGTWAFMTGRLKVRGSQAVARKLNEIFP
jgi:putative sterol carrier protein